MKSFLSYHGGKSRLVSSIVGRIPKHDCYVEGFAGAAWVFFGKDQCVSKSEVINDLNRELVNLYRCVQRHLEEFVKQFKWVLISRDEFDRQKRTDPTTLTDIERAARYYYLLRLGYGAKVTSHHLGTAVKGSPRINLTRVEEELSEVYLRLARVQIENLPYPEIITRCDRRSTFFYLDPPYEGFEEDYGKGTFGKDDFDRLAEILKGIEGKFLMSINDTPHIRSVFKRFNVEPVKTRWVTSPTRKQAGELFIMNY